MSQKPDSALSAMPLKHAGKIYQMLVSISEEAFELGVSLAIMIMVERQYGQQGLGIYAYLTACLYTVRTAADFGVARHTERQAARLPQPGQQQRLIGHSVQAMVITGLTGAVVLLVTAGFDTAHTRVQERVAAYVIMALILPLANLNRLKLFFQTRGETRQAFNLFLVFLPGLIFFGPLTAQEPVYEAVTDVQALRRLTLGVSAVNLILTCYLVPAAGVIGAATATMLTMLIYFLLFGRHLSLRPWTNRLTYLAAGLGLYLIYALLSWLSWSSAVTIWLGPAMAGLLFYSCGLFDPASSATPNRT